MLVQYSKYLLFDLETFHGCCSNTAPKPLSFSRVYDTLFPRRNGKLEDGCVVEMGNVVVRAGGDNGVDSPWIPSLRGGRMSEGKRELRFVR